MTKNIAFMWHKYRKEKPTEKGKYLVVERFENKQYVNAYTWEDGHFSGFSPQITEVLYWAHIEDKIEKGSQKEL